MVQHLVDPTVLQNPWIAGCVSVSYDAFLSVPRNAGQGKLVVVKLTLPPVLEGGEAAQCKFRMVAKPMIQQALPQLLHVYLVYQLAVVREPALPSSVTIFVDVALLCLREAAEVDQHAADTPSVGGVDGVHDTTAAD